MQPIRYRQMAILLFAVLSICVSAQNDKKINVEDFTSFDEAKRNIEKIRLSAPDSALLMYEQLSEYYLAQKDTINAIFSMVEKAVVYGHQGHYQSAYDNLWKAVLLADEAEESHAKTITYVNLGRYAGFYKRKEEALKYYHSALNIGRKLIAEGKAGPSVLVNIYSPLVSTYREFDEFELAETYLDSAYLHFNMDKDSYILSYLKFEEALIKKNKGKYQETLEDLKQLRPWFEQNNPGYFVLLDTYIGDTYLALNDYEKAIAKYQNALKVATEYQSHIDFTPMIYERLSQVFLDKKDYQKAYDYLKQEERLNMQFFDSRSENNRSLLEIKDEFRLEKERQRQLIQKQRIAQLEQEEQLNFLENMLLFIAIIFVVFASVLYVNYLRKKHKVEKALIRKKRELEIKQAEELLELKNKELATSTLKLIEKDEVLSELKNKLSKTRGDVSAFDLKKIVRSINNSSTSNWDEFEKRFISVNKDFYKKLNTQFPKLSRGDQKLCSLIKLNLSSKEMAKLLGISVESVHTNRYRLRKKLGLTREMSLTEFVARL